MGIGVPRRPVYYKPTKATPKADPVFAEPIKALIEKEPAFGCRAVAWLLGFNKNTVQRIFQLEGWQVRKRWIGARPRTEAMPSFAEAPIEQWSTDLCRVWAGKDRWATMALLQPLIARFSMLGRVDSLFLLRSDNGLVFTSRDYTKMVRSYGPKQEFIMPHSPHQALRIRTPAEAFELAA